MPKLHLVYNIGMNVLAGYAIGYVACTIGDGASNIIGFR